MRKLIENHKREVKGKTPKHALKDQVELMKDRLKENLLQKVEVEISKEQNIFNRVYSFIDIQKTLLSDKNDEIKETLASIIHEEQKYKALSFRKWLVFGAGLFVGLFLGLFVPKLVNKVTHSAYNRASLDDIMKTLLGDFRIKETLSDEVLLVAYDYNSQEPRFFSKYFSTIDPNIYNVPVGNATGASSAAPTFFDPKKQQNRYGFTELQIDGGIICNNPALYAYEIAKDFHQH